MSEPITEIGYTIPDSDGNAVDTVDSTITGNDNDAVEAALFALRDRMQDNNDILYFWLQGYVNPETGEKRKSCYLDPL